MDALDGLTEKVGWDKAAMACRPPRQQLNEELTGDGRNGDMTKDTRRGMVLIFVQRTVCGKCALPLQPVPCSPSHRFSRTFFSSDTGRMAPPVGK